MWQSNANMFIAVGVDVIEIVRFSHWQYRHYKQLQRIFSSEEIEYCRSSSLKSAERFAVRFAAREAFLKAFCGLHNSYSISFLSLCKFLYIEKKKSGCPQLVVDWQSFLFGCDRKTVYPKVSLSMSHTKTVALAVVIIQSRYAVTCMSSMRRS